MKKKIAVLTLCSFADAQQHTKVHKFGWLGTRPTTSTGGQETIRRMLRDLGYAEGKNIAFEYSSLTIKSTGSPPSLMSWSVSKLTCSSHPGLMKP